MAIGSTAVWEVRTTGSDANGGFYTSGGTDYSQQDAAQLSVSDGVTNGTTTVTSVTGGFTSAMIGNGINIAGTIRQITARTDTNTITVDATVTTASGQTMKVGGALGSPGKAVGSYVAGNTIWMKAGTYNISTSSSNVSGGVMSFGSNGGTGTSQVVMEGYQTTRGDRGTRPIINVNTTLTSTDVINVGGQDVQIVNLEIACGSFAVQTPIKFTNQGGCAILCKVTGTNVNSHGIQIQSNGFADRCYSKVNTKGISTSGGALLVDCYGESTGSGSTGIELNRSHAVRCIGVSRNAGFGFQASGHGKIDACTSVGAITCNANGSQGTMIKNTIIRDSTSYGVIMTGASNAVIVEGCASWNNTSGLYDATEVIATNAPSNVTLTADPHTNAAGGDYSLNATAGGGAAARGAGVGTFTTISTISHPDIGAVQHQDAGGGVLVNPGMDGL